MKNPLLVYNTLTHQKEVFEPLKPPFVGMYVCGPTVYGDPHLGHARAAITFDLVFRYLKFLGYKVRYVRNITDVGHLENDADAGEDKIAKKARLEQLEPMEVVQHYTVAYHRQMALLNTLPPSIEPSASGHIMEQIDMVRKIQEAGLAYESDGSVYFDVLKYNEQNQYGKLSGRIIDDLVSNTRDLDGQEGKRNAFDFALWKKAGPMHIMRWNSPWGEGFPGWHIECSAMSSKYLGDHFDIHGGGMDLLFPHHECEIAQSVAATGKEPVRYWLHNNMITIGGQKMGKSLGNFITLDQLFSGNHHLLEQVYSPMTIRFFILQAQYRSTLDFSNEALQAAEKGLKRLMTARDIIGKMEYKEKQSNPDSKTESEIRELCEMCHTQMSDDFNSAQVIARLFELTSFVNSFKSGQMGLDKISEETFTLLKSTFVSFVDDVLALTPEGNASGSDLADNLMQVIIGMRQNAKTAKDYAASDKIRQDLEAINVKIKDTKNGVEWSYEE